MPAELSKAEHPFFKPPVEEQEEEKEDVVADAKADEAEEVEEEHKLFDKKAAKTVPIPRFNKVIAERNEGRKTITTQAERIEELEDKSKLVNAFEEHYGKFKDPAAQLAWDQQFMSAMEVLGKSNPAVAQASQLIAAQMEGKTVSEKKTVTKTEEKTAPVADGRIDAIIKRDATRTSMEVLTEAGVEKSMVKIITEHIVANAEDLTALDEAMVTELTTAFIADKGLKPSQVLENVEEAEEKPSTGGSKAPARAIKKASSKKEETPEAPKTMREWAARREARMTDFLAGE